MILLNNVKWGEFKIGDIFEINNLKATHSDNLAKDGYIPYITRTSFNNGVSDFVNSSNKNIMSPGNCIIFGAENADFFYHPYKNVITGNKLYSIRHKKMNKYNGLYLVQAFRNTILGANFGYSNGLIPSRLARRTIILPTSDGNTPDWIYMENYIDSLNKQSHSKLIYFLNDQLHKLGEFKSVSINEAQWETFILGEIISIKNGVRLTKNKMKEGSRPFIGASDSNNGITNFVSNVNNSVGKNTLGVNYNGSVGEGFYHTYEAIFSDDVKQLNFINGVNNEFTLHFLQVSIRQQKDKFGYAYKFNAERMANLRILLPVDRENKINYDFMENYIKGLKAKKIQEVLKFLN